MCYRYREQAHSYRGFVVLRRISSGTKKRQAFAGLPFFCIADAITSPGK
jgi:hypothetical protein